RIIPSPPARVISLNESHVGHGFSRAEATPAPLKRCLHGIRTYLRRYTSTTRPRGCLGLAGPSVNVPIKSYVAAGGGGLPLGRSNSDPANSPSPCGPAGPCGPVGP